MVSPFCALTIPEPVTFFVINNLASSVATVCNYSNAPLGMTDNGNLLPLMENTLLALISEFTVST
jgi:hypothetical protein